MGTWVAVVAVGGWTLCRTAAGVPLLLSMTVAVGAAATAVNIGIGAAIAWKVCIGLLLWLELFAIDSSIKVATLSRSSCNGTNYYV